MPNPNPYPRYRDDRGHIDVDKLMNVPVRDLTAEAARVRRGPKKVKGRLVHDNGRKTTILYDDGTFETTTK